MVLRATIDVRNSMAAWPSTIAALRFCAITCPDSSYIDVAGIMPESSPATAAFEWQIKVHAMIADGKVKEVVVASITMDLVDTLETRGYSRYLLLGFEPKVSRD